jgi:hypothetical protein
MLLVFPVTKADVLLAEKLTEWMLKLGGRGRHDLLVVGTLQTAKEAARIADRLDGKLFVPDTECEIGWPASSNHLWVKTVNHLRNTRNTQPFYWFEADCTPLRAGWLDEVETEYNVAQKPYCGAVQVTRMVDPRTKEFVKADGEHVIGTCVYPADFPTRSTLWKYVAWNSPDVPPWDIYLRHEMRPEVHVSQVIKSHWRTKNYEILKGGRIVCDPIDEQSVYGPVPDEVAVIHGCKDGSLIEALNEAHG